MAQAAYCIRLPYNTMVCAAGHYKQTQNSAIIEMFLNLVITIVFVFKFGLIGVAIGTLVALVYRTVYLAIYLSKNIINYSISYFIRNIIVDIIEVVVIGLLSRIVSFQCNSFGQWIFLACQVFSISVIVVFCVNLVAYRKNMIDLVNNFLHGRKR